MPNPRPRDVFLGGPALAVRVARPSAVRPPSAGVADTRVVVGGEDARTRLEPTTLGVRLAVAQRRLRVS